MESKGKQRKIRLDLIKNDMKFLVQAIKMFEMKALTNIRCLMIINLMR